MAVFTTTVTINAAKLPNGNVVGLTAGRAEVTSGTPYGLVGRNVQITAYPETGYEFVNFIVEEQSLRVTSVDVGLKADTETVVCDPANNLGVNKKLYFTISPTTGNPEPGASLDEAGEVPAEDGFYSGGQSSGTPQYYRLRGGVLNGPFACSTTGGGSYAASKVTFAPTAFVFTRPGRSGTFALTIEDATGRVLSNKNVVWSSSNTNVATVDSVGRVTAGDVSGTAIIRASVKNASGLRTEAYGEGTVTVTVNIPD